MRIWRMMMRTSSASMSPREGGIPWRSPTPTIASSNGRAPTSKSSTLATDLAYLFGRLGIRVTRGEKVVDGMTYYVVYVVGFDRDGLQIPMLTKVVPPVKTHNSSHGYPTRIPGYLATIYRKT